MTQYTGKSKDRDEYWSVLTHLPGPRRQQHQRVDTGKGDELQPIRDALGEEKDKRD